LACVGYRCVFCRQYNPPRQVRPAAEKLPVNIVGEVQIEEMDSDRSEIASPHSVASSIPSPRRDLIEEVTVEDQQGTNEPQDCEPIPSVSEGGQDNESDPVDEERRGMEAEAEPEDRGGSLKSQPAEFGIEGQESEVLPAASEVITPEVKTESAESVSSGENEPFEFVDSDLMASEVKVGEKIRQVAESLSEAAADFPHGSPS